MSGDGVQEGGSALPPRADEVFRREYLEPTQAGGEVDFEKDVVARFPAIEEGLRLLYSLHTHVVEGPSEGCAPGMLLGDRFEVRRELGRGGFGQVFLAVQRDPVERQVALKILRPGLDAPEFLARFELECQALAALAHPNIATLYEAGVFPGKRPYCALEYVDGRPLTEYCDAKRLDVAARLELFCQVCEAVQHAHQRAIIHRDLKPTNVLVAEDAGGGAHVKVIDFGLAKGLDDHRLGPVSLTVGAGNLLGTLEYMSPEQADPSIGAVDTRTDVYALGVMLYELLCGVLPLETVRLQRLLKAGGLRAVIRAICEEEPPPPASKLEGLGERAEGHARARGMTARQLVRALGGEPGLIVRKAMEKSPGQRYGSVSELGGEIRRYLRGEPLLHTFPPRTWYVARKYLWRHRLRLAVAVGAVVLVAAVAGTKSLLDVRAARAQSAALRVEAENALAEYIRLYDAEREMRAELQILAGPATEAWKPVWTRSEELALWRRLQALRGDMYMQRNLAGTRGAAALQAAPRGSQEQHAARLFFDDFHFQEFKEARRGGEIRLGAEYFRRELDAGDGAYAPQLEALGKVALATDPPGAEIYCFRYEEREGRLVPLPFAPGTEGVRADSPAPSTHAVEGLIVEKVWVDAGAADHLAPGDMLSMVNGHAVASLEDLAAALTGLALGEAVSAIVYRGGARQEVQWVAFRQEARWEKAREVWQEERRESFPEGLGPGRLADTYVQLGVTFHAYPLAFRAENRIGLSVAGASLEATLPEGSYLLVCRKEGFAEARVPVAIPLPERMQGLQKIRLVRS